MRRKIFSIFLGLFAGFITFAISHLINSSYHPLPKDVDVQKPEELRQAMGNLPTSYFVGTVICHGLAVCVASFISSLFKGHAWLTAALVPAGLFLLLALGGHELVPHPDWFRWADLAVFVPGGFLGYLIALLLIGNKKQNPEITHVPTS
ncbi:MAG: hypothetical protein ABJZ55_21200 [Fuerstiella sp.]